MNPSYDGVREMMKRSLLWMCGVTVILSLAACDKKADAPKDEPPAAVQGDAQEAAPKEDVAAAPKEDSAPAEPANGEDEAKPAAPAADAQGKLFKQAPVEEQVFDAKELPGKIDGELAFGARWLDFFRQNMIAGHIVKAGKEGDAVTLMLTVRHWRIDAEKGDGSWQLVRDYKELVEGCQFDPTLWAKRGDWSLSDLDSDGMAEFTMAWRSGCRSDVSPNTHKVLVTEDDKKYVLRGQSRLPAPDDKETGKFKADAAFKGAPAAFLTHAEKVWEATVADNLQ